MKKTLIRVVGICAIIGGALIGKYVEDHKTLPKEEIKVVEVDSGYSQDEYKEPISNYDPDFRFPREDAENTVNIKEKPTIKTTKEEAWQGQYAIDTDTYKKNIIKQRSIKDDQCTDDLECREYLMIGYIHEYTFPDFGMKIKTSNPADNEEYFVKNVSSFQRYTDNQYDVITQGRSKYFYIRRYQLASGANFTKEYLEQHNAFTGTIIVTPDNERDDNSIFNTGLVHFYQETPDGSLSSGMGINIGNDEVGNQTVIYLYNPKVQPQYYYKLAYTNACAPSCGIPEMIDIIASK